MRNAHQLPLVDRIIAYESGELDPGEVLELFQQLVDTGMAWQLQGSYGREAKRLIEAGEIEGYHITLSQDED